MDTDTGELVSDAQVAEVPYTAFASKPAKLQAHGRLIVRRVKRLNPDSVGKAQDELFTAWRHHAVFVTSSYEGSSILMGLAVGAGFPDGGS